MPQQPTYWSDPVIDTETLNAWIVDVQGKYINMDGAYGAQCWDLSAHWATWTGKPIINTGGAGRWPGWAGNMVDAFPQSAAIAAAYELIGPDQKGEHGDHAIWGDSYWYYPATHVAVLIADKGAFLTCMSQNSTPSRPDNPYPGASSGPTTIQSLPRQGLIGFIRPRLGSITAQSATITPLEEDMPLTKEDIDNIAARVVEVIQPIEDITRQYLADRTRDAALAVLNGSQAQEDVTRAYLVDTTQAQSDVTRQFLADRIKETPAADLAAQIDAAGIASQVRDELVKLLTGK